MTAPRPLTVLHLAANRWWTGSADPTIQLVAGLRSRGHRVLLGAIPGDRLESKAQEAGVALVRGLRLDTRSGPIALGRDVLRLRAVIREESVDVIHAHHSHDHWLAVLARPRRASHGRPPVIRTFHNLRSVKRDRLSRRLYRSTAAVLVVSRQIQARCHDVGIPAPRVAWLPGIVDLGRFATEADARAIRDEFRLGDAPVVVSVARLAPNRGHELLLDGFRLLLGSVPDARLLLVGKGETRQRLESRVAQLRLQDRVLFTGYRDRDLPEVLAAADCFVLMAAGSDESCRAALEAMAAGRPVVARGVGALPETVIDGETGVLIDDDRPERVAEALRVVLGDRQRARTMGARGRRRVQEEFGVARAVDIVEGIYRSLV